MSIRSRHLSVAARVLAIVALLLGMGVAVAGGAAASAAQHPYSNPIWWPVNAPTGDTKMACYHGNGADCRNPLQHAGYAMDVAAANNSSLPVYAMGAGVAHVMETHWRCGDNNGRGNWLFVDHANGTTSEYGHLGTIFVKTGQLVTPRTELATIWRSGYQRACDYPAFSYVRYLWLAVRHNGTYLHFTTSYTCVDRVKTLWPTHMSTYPTDDWNKVPAHTPIPTSDRSCVPAADPATPTQPSINPVVRRGAGALGVTWRRASSADRVGTINVELQEFHPSVGRWSDYANRRLSSGYTATTFTGLQKGRQFQIRIWMANTVGWSAPSHWASGVPA